MQMIISNQGSGVLSLAMQGGNTSDISILSLSPSQSLAVVNDGGTVWHHLWSEVGTTGPYSVGNATVNTHAVNKGQADGLYLNNVVYSPNVTPLPGASTLFSYTHGLSSIPANVFVEAVCLVAESGYGVGDIVSPYTASGSSYDINFSCGKNATTVFSTTGTQPWAISHKTTGVSTAMTSANWAYRFNMRVK
jgi:hypothetical protein